MGLVSNHVGILHLIVRVSDGRTFKQLSGAFQLPKTTMTQILKSLGAH